MMKNRIIYYPLTAIPFKKNVTYREVVPHTELQPYIRCFWGMEHPIIQAVKENAPQIVIPDTCADIIYHIDYTDNIVSGGFCGVNDISFYAHHDSKAGHLISTFAIRFYAWSAYAVSEDSLKDTINGYYEVGSRFDWLDKELKGKLLELKTLQEKVSYVEKLCMGRLENAKAHKIVDSTINNILLHRGSLEVTDLARDAFVSSRQLERLFHEYVGITPKKLSNLIRYQLLWRDILQKPGFDILDAVHKYGYTDQAHLLHEFKRYHSMDIRSAKAMAFRNVENIQDILA